MKLPRVEFVFMVNGIMYNTEAGHARYYVTSNATRATEAKQYFSTTAGADAITAGADDVKLFTTNY